MARQYNVNRHTVRRAISRLAELGLVKVEQGRGTFVTRNIIDYPIQKRTRFSETVKRQNRIPSGTLLLTDIQTANQDLAFTLNTQIGTPILRIEILNMIDGDPVSIGNHYFSLIRFPSFEDIFKTTMSITKTLTRLGHANYERRHTKIIARMPESREADILRQSPNRPVLTTESINVDFNNKALEFGISCFAADRFQILVET